MSRFVIVCGGTGGHLSPGIALAEKLQERGHECKLVISEKDVDSQLIKKYPDMEWFRLPGVGFSWRPLQLIVFFWTQLRAFWLAFRRLRKIKPDLVVGFGGFLTVSVVLVGFIQRRIIVLHEANRVPGKAIRLLSTFAERVYLPEGVRLRSLPPHTVRHCGFPLRKEIRKIRTERARRSLNLPLEGKLLVVLGGSQGANCLNQWVLENCEYLASEGVHLVCVTGLGKGTEGSFQQQRSDGKMIETRFIPFCDSMAALLSSADLVVSRAGAGSIAEFIRCRVPAILVPLPSSADNHQAANAAFFERSGGGIVVAESKLGELRHEVIELIFNDWLLGRLHKNLLQMEDTSVERLVNDLEALARGEGRL